MILRLPTLTSLQFLVLAILGAKEVAGAEVRERLKKHRVRKDGPAFYQLMARMEEGGLVEGRYVQEIIEGQIIKQRCYRVTALGERSRQEAIEFYSGRKV